MSAGGAFPGGKTHFASQEDASGVFLPMVIPRRPGPKLELSPTGDAEAPLWGAQFG